MRRSVQGMSLVIVLLFSAIFITALMVSSSFVNLGTISTAAKESRSTTALFAADSLLSRIEAKLKSQPAFTSGMTPTDVQTWLTTQGVATLTLPNAATATISVANVNAAVTPAIITLKSTGRSSDATQVLLKEFKVLILNSSMYISTPGALNAYPPVDANGQPNIVGQTGSAVSGSVVDSDATKRIVLNGTTSIPALAYGQTTTLLLSDPRNPTTTTARVNVPSYIEMTTSSNPATLQRFKVTSKTATALTVTPLKIDPLSTSFTGTFANQTQIGLNPLAMTQPIGLVGGLSITNVMDLPVTDPYSFYASDKVYVQYRLANGTTGTAVGAVQARLQENGATDSTGKGATKIRVNFNATACTGCSPIPLGATVSEGTPLRREVYGVVSHSTVAQKNANFTFSQNDSRIANPSGSATTACPSGNLLFCETFKTDYNAFIAQYPPVNKSSLNNLSGITVVNSSNGWNGNNGICGSGILIVIGDFSANSSNSCPSPFRGLIYVTGNAYLQGNLELRGGMVVEGEVTNKSTIGTVEVGGSGAQSTRLTYDLMALTDASKLLASQTFTPVQGTWRQQ